MIEIKKLNKSMETKQDEKSNKEIICSKCCKGKMIKKEDGYWYCDKCNYTVAVIIF